MAKFLEKIFGTHSSRELKKIYPIIDKIDALEEDYKKLSEKELKHKTVEFKERLANGETLDDILVEAFATVREASWRVLGMRHYRVQLIGGLILHQGRIAEMRTGEGKTLVGTLPAYLNALSGKGVHIITVNDYLAKRDSEWMGKLYRYLGLKVGLVIHDVPPTERKASYDADITYGTNNEFGFDYLRDNMAIYKQNMVQRGHNFAVVDEVDSILIDEARTPLIISGQGDKATDIYKIVDVFAKKLSYLRQVEVDTKEEQDEIEHDVIIDEKGKNASLTPKGLARAEKHFNVENLAETDNSELLHHINQAIRAHGIMQLDVDYVVRDGAVVIVDEFTGRLMLGRRYSDGLHQAIEAKEGVKVERESKTLATITFQNYFRLYTKLSGMTGTALTEEEEFRHIYKLDVVEIPTNKVLARIDRQDTVYRSERGKLKCVAEKVKECYAKGQPVLVGTVSIERSEYISSLLKREGIKHNVLNAKFHEQEAEIIAQAGKLGAVTIATNMAGRGTDIMLGGNAEYLAKNDMKKQGYDEALIVESTGFADTDDEQILEARAKFTELQNKYKAVTSVDAEKVREAGGLCIIGTERHESRRIDNQLRGRAGRQGDPGESIFMISLEDDLMRLFGAERIMSLMDTLNVEEDMPIEQRMLTGAIEGAQRKVEGRNFQTRKHVLEYDDVMNLQRKVVYEQRLKVLMEEDIEGNIQNMIETSISNAVFAACGEDGKVTRETLLNACKPYLNVFLFKENATFLNDETIEFTPETLKEKLIECAKDVYARKETALTSRVMRELERVVLLRNVDTLWMEHIDAMQELRGSIGLRAYGQHNPVIEYKNEGFAMFEEMIDNIREHTVRAAYLARIQGGGAPKREKVAEESGTSSDGTVQKQPVRKTAAEKVGRNDPCPCGSGKKHKKCCGFDPNATDND